MRTSLSKCMLGMILFLATSSLFAGEPGLYGGVGVGISNDDASEYGTTSGRKAFLGYDFNKYVAVEVAYVDIGHFATKRSFVASGYGVTGRQLAVLGVIPFDNSFVFFGKAGIYSWTATPDLCFFSCSVSGTSASAALGVQYMFIQNLGVRAEMEFFGQVYGWNTEMISASVIGHF